jgi:hypothetical protein
VFANKLKALVDALKKADRIANRQKSHDFLIVNLKASSAEAVVRERPSNDAASRASSIHYVQAAVGAVYSGYSKDRNIPLDFIGELADLSKGIGQTFTHGEITFDGAVAIRIDDFFAAQVERALKDESQDSPDIPFKGVSVSSFDGILREISHFGRLVRGVLILTAGGKRIDCIFDSSDFPNLRESWDKRARVEGIAYYTGETDIPERLDVKRISLIKEKPDLLRWKGALKRKRNFRRDTL